MRKVVWAGRDEVLNSTVVVLVSVVIISLFLHATDWGFEVLFNYLVRLGSGS